jgi:glycosyltransferase involved in cell wall biosynthesis
MPEAAPNLPKVTAIVPVRNEEANIAAAVESLAAQVPPIEIVVVNDDSTDRTGKTLAGLQERFANLRVIENQELPEGWTGKNHACHLGAKEASGEWLLFTDADVRHAPQAVAVGLGLAKQHQAALVSFSPEQEMRTWWERMIIPYVFCQLADAYPYEKVNDPDSPKAAANGQWLLISRLAYETIGGHEAIRGEILEDVALARHVKEAGHRIHFGPAEGVARTRMYRRWGEMWQGWSKNLLQLVSQGNELLWIIFPDSLYPLVVILAYLFHDPESIYIFLPLLFLLDHAAYWSSLTKYGFSSSNVIFLFPAKACFYALVVSSWFAHKVRGRVDWKGRSYNT